MDTNTVNTSGPSMTTPQNQQEKPVGPVIGLIVILAVILIGGIYFWSSQIKNPVTPENTGDQNNTSLSTEVILEQSSSDDTSSIESDLNKFDESDIDSLDSGF